LALDKQKELSQNILVNLLRRQKIIERWLLGSREALDDERYEDLRIDKVDEQLKPREVWFDEGIETLQLAIELRDRHALDVTVTLGFSLFPGKPLLKFDFKKKLQFMRHIDWTPPSLYLFQRNGEPWTQAGGGHASSKIVLQDLSTINREHPRIVYCCYMEFKQDAVLHRKFFLAG
jgi:hypothetical protein